MRRFVVKQSNVYTGYGVVTHEDYWHSFVFRMGSALAIHTGVQYVE